LELLRHSASCRSGITDTLLPFGVSGEPRGASPPDHSGVVGSKVAEFDLIPQGAAV